MSKAVNSYSRVGNFSSSQIYLLMKGGRGKDEIFGQAAKTYIKGKKRELLLNRPLQKERSSRPTSWGKLIEPRVYELLPTEYILCSDERLQHEEIERWNGAPDMKTEIKVCDIKAPYSLDVFCDKADIMMANDIEALKRDFPENYWQLVSNSILTGLPIAELIIYCPYLSELVEIKEDLGNYAGDANEVAWINWAADEELPYLIKGEYYQNLYKMSWTVSEEDKQLLYDRVKLALTM